MLHVCLQGYSDPEYRKRRAFISELAFRYKQWVRYSLIIIKHKVSLQCYLIYEYSVSQGGPAAHCGVHSRGSVHMVRMSCTVLHVINADTQWRMIKVQWCVVVLLTGGRFTGSCRVFTLVWPAGSSWTGCSSWRGSVAMERTASLSSERSPPSWKVRQKFRIVRAFWSSKIKQIEKVKNMNVAGLLCVSKETV